MSWEQSKARSKTQSSISVSWLNAVITVIRMLLPSPGESEPDLREDIAALIDV